MKRLDSGVPRDAHGGKHPNRRQAPTCQAQQPHDIIVNAGRQVRKGSEAMVLMAQFFWKIFETTGSITAYLLYKRFLTQ